MPDFRVGYLIAGKEATRKAELIMKFSGFKASQRSVSAAYAAISGPQEWRLKILKHLYEKGGY